MRLAFILTAGTLGLAAVLTGPVTAAPIAYELPPETPELKPGEHMELAMGYCLGCHSLDYITTQPPTVPPGFWQASVTKMKTVYGAPVPDEDATKIVAYLNATYRKP
jgi:hypothetical protein